VIDLISCIPIDYIVEAFLTNSVEFLKAFGILKLARLTRLSKLLSKLELRDDTKAILKML
jgi:hypothetical protein